MKRISSNMVDNFLKHNGPTFFVSKKGRDYYLVKAKEDRPETNRLIIESLPISFDMARRDQKEPAQADSCMESRVEYVFAIIKKIIKIIAWVIFLISAFHFWFMLCKIFISPETISPEMIILMILDPFIVLCLYFYLDR